MTDAPEPAQPQPAAVPLTAGKALLVAAWTFGTPALAGYAARYPDGDAGLGLLVYGVVLGAMFVLFRPGSPLYVANRLVSLALRVAITVGTLGLLVVRELMVWAVIYAVFGGAALAVARLVVAQPEDGDDAAARED